MKIDSIYNDPDNFILTAEDRYDRAVLKFLVENYHWYSYFTGIRHQVRTDFHNIGGIFAINEDLKSANNALLTKTEKSHC